MNTYHIKLLEEWNEGTSFEVHPFTQSCIETDEGRLYSHVMKEYYEDGTEGKSIVQVLYRGENDRFLCGLWINGGIRAPMGNLHNYVTMPIDTTPELNYEYRQKDMVAEEIVVNTPEGKFRGFEVYGKDLDGKRCWIWVHANSLTKIRVNVEFDPDS